MLLQILLISAYAANVLCADIPYSEYELVFMAHADGGVSQVSLANKEIHLEPNIKDRVVIEFDNRHNCLFFASVSVIKRRCYVKNNYTDDVIYQRHSNATSIDQLAFDYISDNLYFTDSLNRRIELLRVLHEEHRARKMRHPLRTVHTFDTSVKLRGLAVSPAKGFLFWTDVGYVRPAIWRSNLDGTNAKSLVERPTVVNPSSITIDYHNDHIYWVDMVRNEIGRCDFDGEGLEIFIRPAPYAPSIIYRGQLFTSTPRSDSLVSFNTESTILDRTMLLRNISSFTDMAIATGSKPSETNACTNEHKCNEICVGNPTRSYSCLCPNGLEPTPEGHCLCPGPSAPLADGTCPSSNYCDILGEDLFRCRSGNCVPLSFRCDGEADCEDGEDEAGCPSVARDICPTNYFRCKSDGLCRHLTLQCNYQRDCYDGSDEENCASTNCNADQFRCNDHKCISQKWVCDGDRDCPDGADEMFCAETGINYHSCPVSQFSCGDGVCIHKSWVCDGETDCNNGRDESMCSTTTTTPRPRQIPANNTLTRTISAIETSVHLVTGPNNSYGLQWSAPADAVDTEYVVHYGKTMEQLNEPRLYTRNKTIQFEDLEPCEKYIAGVTLRNRTVTKFVHISTRYDPTEPPQNTHFSLNETAKMMVISWQHSCTLPNNYPSQYFVNITDIMLGTETSTRVPSTNDLWQKFRYGPIPRGARYNVSIFSENQRPDSITVYQVHAFKLPAPSPLTVKPLQDDRYIISWPRVRYNDTAFEYEFLVTKGYVLADDSDFVLRATTKNISITLDVADLGGQKDTAANFTIGVRIKTAAGYTSVIDDYERIEARGGYEDDDDDDDDGDKVSLFEEESLIQKFETEMIIIGAISLFLGLTFFVAIGIWYCNNTRSPPVDETPMRPIRRRPNIYQPSAEAIFTLGEIKENDEEERLIDQD